MVVRPRGKKLFLLLILGAFACSPDEPSPRKAQTAMEAWADLTLRVVKETPNNTPTFTSRALGYLGLTMYETVVNGSDRHVSIASKLNALGALPEPDAGQQYNWVIALNAGQAYLLHALYSKPLEILPALRSEIDNLEKRVYETEVLGATRQETALRSAEYGRAVAATIYEWSKTDGGHEGNLTLFDAEYEIPSGPGFWTPPIAGQSSSPFPLHPYWGGNRTFVPANATLPLPKLATYSTDPSSDYYNEFKAVYEKRRTLTLAEKNTAVWWADDPALSFSPPGHSYHLATLYIRETKADIFDAAEIYARVGIAVADAFIECWRCKYTYHSERPYPYIRDFIDSWYDPFWPEPPFPAFSSGHATQSAAVAMVLIYKLGNNVTIMDNTHENRSPDWPEISYSPRQFTTIWEMAEECAYSRFLGGIHTQQDNAAGLAQGKLIGKNVAELGWSK
jgi:hypothetical protein